MAHSEGATGLGVGAVEPADRLEQALNRIAFALDRGRPDPVAAPAADTQAVDLHALAANIDILIARIRDVIGDDVLQQDGPPHDEDR